MNKTYCDVIGITIETKGMEGFNLGGAQDGCTGQAT